MVMQEMVSWGVETVVDELLRTREGRGCSGRWILALESVLCRFASFAPVPISALAPADCDAFIASLNVGPRSRNNAVGMLRQLFRFAVRRRYVPADFLPLATLEPGLVRNSVAKLYTPVELARILAAASPVLRPIIALTAFCGVRSAEAQRLEWSDVKLDRSCVFVDAAKAKTASRRVCPTPGQAREWLTPAEGRIWPGTLPQHTHALRDALAAAGVKSRRNGLRHSFISYRLAIVQDAQKVALEAGTSPQVIFSNYRELVTEEEAQAWFAVRPVSGQLELDLAA